MMKRVKSGRPVDKHVGGQVRMRRLMLNISQTTLGEAVGVSFQQIQKYENGVNRIGASRLLHIAYILGVPAAFLFDGAPGPQGNGADNRPLDELTEFMTTREGVELAKAFMQISNGQLRRRIMDLVEQIEQNQT
jgi:transcriptional regulator with XRE-family HTH domain